MTKRYLLLLLIPLVFTNAVANPQVKGFIDSFDVTLTAQANPVAPIITFIPAGHQGGIVAQDYYCDSNGKTCHFETTDNYSGKNGQVEFLIGVNKPDNTLTYCDIVIKDGATVAAATMTASCNPQGAITTTALEHPYEYNYTFEIQDAN